MIAESVFSEVDSSVYEDILMPHDYMALSFVLAAKSQSKGIDIEILPLKNATDREDAIREYVDACSIHDDSKSGRARSAERARTFLESGSFFVRLIANKASGRDGEPSADTFYENLRTITGLSSA